MNSRVQKFKQELNRVFDDNLRTKQWHNYVDYAIIGFIILSTVLHDTLEPEKILITPPEMLKRPKGHDFGMDDYVD